MCGLPLPCRDRVGISPGDMALPRGMHSINMFPHTRAINVQIWCAWPDQCLWAEGTNILKSGSADEKYLGLILAKKCCPQWIVKNKCTPQNLRPPLMNNEQPVTCRRTCLISPHRIVSPIHTMGMVPMRPHAKLESWTTKSKILSPCGEGTGWNISHT